MSQHYDKVVQAAKHVTEEFEDRLTCTKVPVTAAAALVKKVDTLEADLLKCKTESGEYSQEILQKNLVAERQSVGAGHRTDTENLVRPFPTAGRNGQ